MFIAPPPVFARLLVNIRFLNVVFIKCKWKLIAPPSALVALLLKKIMFSNRVSVQLLKI